MTDSTDNARGPERIWVCETENGERYWQEEHYATGTAFIRADLAPDPQDARVGALVGALIAMLDHSGVADAGPDMKDPEDHAAERQARAALAAFDKGGKDE